MAMKNKNTLQPGSSLSKHKAYALLFFFFMWLGNPTLFSTNNQTQWQPGTIIIKFQENSQVFADLKNHLVSEQEPVFSPNHNNVAAFQKSFETRNGLFLRAAYDFFMSNPLLSIEPLIISKLNAQTKQGLERIFLIKIKYASSVAEVAYELGKMDGIEYAEPDYTGYGGGKPSFAEDFYQVYTPTMTPPVNDANFHFQYGLLNTGQFIGGIAGIPGADINIVPGWDITTGSTEVILGILDSGMPSDHFDFEGRVTAGYNFVSDNNDYLDDHGHGSSVTSIAAATGNNSGLMAGTDWNSQILPVKILNEDNSGYYSWWINGITYATDQGAHVVNMSVGGSSYSSALHDAINYALSNDVIVVACMMNENNDVTYYPAGFEGVIAVGATNNTDERAEPFSWGGGSNYGNHIDFAAPGDRIASLGGSDFQSIAYWSGTSMATPFVAGTISLMLSIDPVLTSEPAYDILKETTRPQVVGKTTDEEEWNQFTGWGRIDAFAALQLTLAGTTPSSNEHILRPNNQQVKLFPNPASNMLQIEVSQNITSLQIIDFSGKTLYQSEPFAGQQQISMDVSTLKEGIYLVRFMGHNQNITQKLIIKKP